MRKMMCSLVAIAAASGCGSDSDSTDRSAPNVTISAPATVEGGASIAITVNANDDKDPSITPTLTCTGGTLTGTMLRTADVTQATTITCTAQAKDVAGNTGTANVNIAVTPVTRTIAPMAFATEAAPGGIGTLLATNVPLEQASYDGTFAGRPVKLFRTNGNQLLYVLPTDVPAGAGQLTFQIGQRSFSAGVTVTPLTVTNPRDVVARSLDAFRTATVDAINGQQTSAADRARLQSALPKLDAAIAELPSLTEQQALGLATFLTANGLVPTISSAFYNPIVGGENCLPALKQFGKDAAKFLLAGAVLAESINLAVVAPVALPAIIGAGIGLAAGAYGVVEYGRATARSRRAAFSVCWTEVDIQLVPTLQLDARRSASYQRPLAVVAKQGFTQGETRSFRVQRSFAPLAEFRAEIQSTITSITSYLGVLSLLPGDVAAGLSEAKVDGTEEVPVDRVGLGSISRGDIGGQVTRSGNALLVTFNKTNPEVTENIDFSFVLSRTQETPIEVPAQLVIKLPEADGASVQTSQGGEVTSTVTTRGADTLEIVTQPANGTVTLNNNGSFVYRPNASFFGTDRFTYRARNKAGASQPATVELSVVRRFEGAWKISTRTTTTSESPAGLCPNEQAQFPILVSKVSDTLYTVSYQGFTLNLSMASIDDPAGLRGSITVTYDDDPGKTTETLTINVPDSARITGSSTFSYTGPNNSRCSGTTEVTGTR